MNQIVWTSQRFLKFDAESLYELLALRQQVFVVEQNCAYLDADGGDRGAVHILGRQAEGALVAYCRIYPKSDGWHIGRVLVAQAFRRQGLATELMHQALKQCEGAHPEYPQLPLQNVHLSAQCHLTEFYQSLGFSSVGDAYVEDGIPHQDMTRHATARGFAGMGHE